MPNDPTVHFEYNEAGDARSRAVYENGDSEQLKLTAVAPELYRLEESSSPERRFIEIPSALITRLMAHS
jgi:hypothetical protein